MDAIFHPIETRSREHDIGPARFDDFTLGAGTIGSDRRLIDEPGWTIYALDIEKRMAMFVLLLPESDIANAAFSGVMQFEQASAVALVPFATLELLAAQVALPDRMVLIFNMGRSGTTLASKMLNRVEGVWSLSEPDVHFDLVMSRRQLEPAEEQMLVSATTRLLFRPPAHVNAHTLAIKFRSQSLFHAEKFQAAFPMARNIFLYRDASGWANSFYRLMQNFGLKQPLNEEQRHFAWWMHSAAKTEAYLEPYLDIQAPEVRAEDFMAAAWLLYVEKYLSLYKSGMPFLAVRYDELNGAQRETTQKLLSYCGLPLDHTDAVMRAFEEDSQKGTTISRDNSAAPFTEAEFRQFAQTLARHPDSLAADLLLPDDQQPGRLQA